MAKAHASPGKLILATWERLGRFPARSWIFSRLMSFMVPYTGSVGARVEVLEAGYARVTLKDRRRVRNHLDSIHAVALVNLGEMTSGLALLAGLSPELRGIVTGLEIEYLKKARGRLIAESTLQNPPHSSAIPLDGDAISYPATATIRDTDGDDVALFTATWQLKKK